MYTQVCLWEHEYISAVTPRGHKSGWIPQRCSYRWLCVTPQGCHTLNRGTLKTHQALCTFEPFSQLLLELFSPNVLVHKALATQA